MELVEDWLLVLILLQNIFRKLKRSTVFAYPKVLSRRTDLGELPDEQDPANLPFGASLIVQLEKIIDQLYAETPEPKILNILDVQIVELDFEFMMS